mmetsp:Transcript_18779/g.25787  ORF Transcript_18779/g.25787 Transcript_18779/m.25787 type:complete len:324 (+) Transcript_18779:82-1053(+)
MMLSILKLQPHAHGGLLFSGGVIGGLNLAGFAVTAALETHKLTDLVGAGSFVASAVLCARRAAGPGGVGALPLRAALLAGAGAAWGTRLAGYLFRRVLYVGGDDRLDSFYPEEGEGWFNWEKSFYPVKLSGFWVIQAAWGWLVSAPVTLAIFNAASPNAGAAQAAAARRLGWGGALSLAAFVGGLLLEWVADQQKWVFKKKEENKGKWIETGVWRYSRHPNYFGETAVWWGLLGLAAPLLRGPGQLALGLASPLFTTLLLTQVSGIPMLEKKYDARYANSAEYQAYKARTNVLIPWFPRPLVKNDVVPQPSSSSYKKESKKEL